MKLLKKPYTTNQYNEFVCKCNEAGNLRIEKYNGNAYALLDFEILKNGTVIDLRDTEEYIAKQAQIAKEERTQEILAELDELDKKRIRALCEPDELRQDGTSWLDYYNSQIAELRKELNS